MLGTQTLASKPPSGDRVILSICTLPLSHRAPVRSSDLLLCMTMCLEDAGPSPRHLSQPWWSHLLASDWWRNGHMTFWPVGVPDSGAPESVALLLETQARNVPFPASGCDIWTPAAILQPWGALVCDKSLQCKEVQVKSYSVGPDSSGPAAILLLDSSHALVLLLFKTPELGFSVLCSWNILAALSVENFLQFTFSAVMRISTQLPTRHLFVW